MTSAGRPGARQIYEALRAQILEGVFGRHGNLPSSRMLALELGVSRTTVTAAYEQLVAEGFIEVRQGARPRVASVTSGPATASKARRPERILRLSAYGARLSAAPAWPERKAESLIADFRYGDLTPSDFPATVWRRAMNAVMTRRPERLAYDDPRGSRRLRLALQGYLWRARGLSCAVEQIIVVSGSQQGLDLCARLFLEQGERFAIENPCYGMARQIFAGTGAVPVAIAVDGDGLKTDMLAGIDARLAYVTPSHQFPLGSVMSVSRRQQLIDWASRNEAFVIEDDYDSEYRYDINPVPPLYGLGDSENVIYLGTISKTLSPTMRIGYLVVPSDLQALFTQAKRLTDRHSPLAEQEALASLIESGVYERHVRRMRRLNGERRESLLNALRLNFGDRIAVEGADAGLHLAVRFRDLPRRAETRLVELAHRAGVGLHALSPLYENGHCDGDEAGAIMGYAALDTRQIERGVQLLAQCAVEARRQC